ncbi:TIP41-domain-containing protein [Cystobasidium minutum MCA 4210]|uniref:TIP41-domain-containing protein n=1 Tax=Cystobasidium minutum MCA 4210 TaxID=1397322 RepID=UPI0034CDD980|eukprot:jgi/Rhomi1/165005/fgenesh1_kg.1_\
MATRMPAFKRMPHEVWEEGPSRGIRIGQWEVETRKQAILNASEIEDAATRLDIPLPEITFGNNLVSLKRKGKQRAVDSDPEGDTNIVFNGLDALSHVDTTGQDTIKVAYAKKWAQSRNLDNAGSGSNGEESTAVIETVKNYDWTYSTDYKGTCKASTSFQPAPVDHPGIPLSRLAKQDEPILFFDEVTLFEDELHDNGVANLTIRIRVMPSGLFILSRFFLRVDNVLFRIFDVRLYHDFSTDEIIRETKGKEAPYDLVRKRLPRERADDLTPLTDHNWVAGVLGMLEKEASITSRPGSASLALGGRAAPMATVSEASTSAPWTAARRQVLPNVSLPVRVTASPAQVLTVTESEQQQQQPTMPFAHGAQRPWSGLGTHLELSKLH